MTQSLPALQPYEQRVVAELNDLNEKRSKLITFIQASPVFAGLDPHDQNLLRHQLGAMNTYSEILTARIARFTAGPAISLGKACDLSGDGTCEACQ